MHTAIQFGAGNIGRGFMGQLFFEAGYQTVFVEKNDEIVHLISERAGYPLRLLDAYSKKEIDLAIHNVDALDFGDATQIAIGFADAEVAGTAVGVENLESIAPLIALGVRNRMETSNGPIDIYLCENSYAAASTLKSAVLDPLSRAEKQWTEENVGFVGTAVARMVPTSRDRFKNIDPLFVVADSYHKLPFDQKATRAALPPIEGLVPASNFKAEVERKLFTHNLGHAVLGYVGYLKGYSYVHEALLDPDLGQLFDGALSETAAALTKKYPQDIDREEHQKTLADVRVRFSNPLIMDTVQRVSRDPLRKLAPEDRLIGSANMCLSNGVFPSNIACACGAALCYDYPDDPGALRLQHIISTEGVEKALQQVAGIEADSELGAKILGAYQELRNRHRR